MKKIVASVLLCSMFVGNVGCMADTTTATQDEDRQQPERTGEARDAFAPQVAAALMAAAAAITAAILAGRQQQQPPPPVYRPPPDPGTYPGDDELPRLPDPRDPQRWLSQEIPPRR